MPTRQDLIRETLKKLNAIAAGQSPEAEDVETIDESLDGLLIEAGINVGIYFNTSDDIDKEFIDPLATIIANGNAPGFGQPQNEVSRMAAINRLRYLRPSDYVGQPQTVSYF